ncbi:Uncharacterised protein [Arcanobacterium haemolyticum]|nr:Uncharacterised protein [Arcanobacterium haemolyticum]
MDFVGYPFTPDALIATVNTHTNAHSIPFQRITIGMPGIIRNGRVIHTPHYIRTTGPGGTVDPELVSAWTGADVKGLVETTTRLPALVVNDAIVTAAGVITGNGSELVLTFGTGLGVAFAVDGTLTEHIEVSHAPSPLGGTFDDTVGAINVSGADPALWSENILRVIDSLWPMYRWDQLYVGGGNAFKLTAPVRARLADAGVKFLDYEAGARGGAAAWEHVK